jgi:hypothetical protein
MFKNRFLTCWLKLCSIFNVSCYVTQYLIQISIACGGKSSVTLNLLLDEDQCFPQSRRVWNGNRSGVD